MDNVKAELTKINSTFKAWQYNLGVLDEVTHKDNAIIANNTKLIDSANQSSSFAGVAGRVAEANTSIQKGHADYHDALAGMLGESPTGPLPDVGCNTNLHLWTMPTPGLLPQVQIR